jgi:hypothetical protein
VEDSGRLADGVPLARFRIEDCEDAFSEFPSNTVGNIEEKGLFACLVLAANLYAARAA